MARQLTVNRKPQHAAPALTRAELLDLPAAVPLWPDAARALGVGRTKAYSMIRDGSWPTRLLYLGTTIKVPTAELLDLLGIHENAVAAPQRD